MSKIVKDSFVISVIISVAGRIKLKRAASKREQQPPPILDDLFSCGRICKYCGINMDTVDLESLKFFHGTCWQEYRKNNELYPLPENVGDC